MFGLILGCSALIGAAYVAHRIVKADAADGRITKSSTLRVVCYTGSIIAALCLQSWGFLLVSLVIDEWSISDYEQRTLIPSTLLSLRAVGVSTRDLYEVAPSPRCLDCGHVMSDNRYGHVVCDPCHSKPVR